MRIMRWFAESRKGGWRYKVKGSCRETAGASFTMHRLGNNQWKVSGYGSDGKQKRFKFIAESIDEAIAVSEKILGIIPPEAPERLTLDVVFSRWLESLGVNSTTFKDYSTYIDQFLGWVEKRNDIARFTDLRLEHLQAYSNDLVRLGYSQNTIRLYLMPIKAAAKWASINWAEQINDAGKGFRLPKVIKTSYDTEEEPALSFHDVCKFLEYVQQIPDGRRVIIGIALQALAGLRITEVLRLTADKLNRDLLTVEGIVKNAPSIRRIPLSALVLDIIARYHRGNRFTDYVQYREYSKAITKLMDRWALQSVGQVGYTPTAHIIIVRELRRTIPTEFRHTGSYGYILERYLGHSEKTITDKHYVSLPESKKLELMRVQVCRPINRATRSFRETLGAKKHEKSTVDKVLFMDHIRKCR